VLLLKDIMIEFVPFSRLPGSGGSLMLRGTWEDQLCDRSEHVAVAMVVLHVRVAIRSEAVIAI